MSHLASFDRFRERALGQAPAGFALCKAVPIDLRPSDLEHAPEATLWERHREAMTRWRALASGPPLLATAAGLMAPAGFTAAAGFAAPAGHLAPAGSAAPAGPPAPADLPATAGLATPPAAPPHPAAAAERDGGARTNLLELKAALARRLLGPCRLCWLRCPVDRRAGQTGACGLGAGLRPYADFVHLGEELELIPTHAVYLAGCNYRCPYCSDWSHDERPREDPEVEVGRLSRSIAARRREGVLSLSFVGGVPDVNLPGLLAALTGAQASVPIVWNSNMSSTPEAHDLLEGVVDAYVADLKYGAEACARTGSAVKGSLAVAQQNLLRVRPEAFLIVRHLVLPGHVDCCALPALDWLAEHLPGARVNLMDQYRPNDEVAGTVWDRRPAAAELERARAHARALPLDLAGPGRIEGPPTGPWASIGLEGSPEASAPVAAFSSQIAFDDGRLVVENLSPELVRLVASVGAADPDIEARLAAAQPWLRATASRP